MDRTCTDMTPALFLGTSGSTLTSGGGLLAEGLGKGPLILGKGFAEDGPR